MVGSMTVAKCTKAPGRYRPEASFLDDLTPQAEAQPRAPTEAQRRPPREGAEPREGRELGAS